MLRIVLALSLLWGSVVAVQAAEPPEAITKMLTEAVHTKDRDTVIQTAILAKKAYPDSVLEIDRLVARLTHEAAQAELKDKEPPKKTIFKGWTGEGELGASHSSGNSTDTTVAAALNLRWENIDWRNHFTATADYKRSAGVANTERLVVSHEIQYKINDKLFTTGLLEWEHDRFAGFDNRYSESFGLGYNVYRSKALAWDVSLGPAFRQTDRSGFTTGPAFENETQARLSTTGSWIISPTMTMTEEASFYFGAGNRTYQSTTAFTSKIIGQLSARASFFYKKETAPPVGLFGTDTISRLTLVYGF
jgi:putative salt-induced outer membrane protein